MTGRSTPARAPRGSLTRQRIVDAAVELADTDGIAGLSMPKLARRLGVGVMSLYSHVASKDDLVDAVAQRLLEQLPPTDSSLDWTDAVSAHFRALRQLLVAHPGLGDALATRGITVPAVVDILQANLAALRGGGFTPIAAVRTYYALLTYTLGFVAWELPRAHLSADGYSQRWQQLIDGIPKERYPTLHELAAPLATVASEEQFDFGLQHLLNSVSCASKKQPER